MKTYSGKITKLLPNQIFVFGSNPQCRHGRGAAKSAMKFGAVYGKNGFRGQTYSITTKDLRKKKHPSISSDVIKNQIRKLYEFAKEREDLEFMIAYSGIGFNLNGYTNQEMADMFSSFEIPENIVFEENFYKLIYE